MYVYLYTLGGSGSRPRGTIPRHAQLIQGKARQQQNAQINKFTAKRIQAFNIGKLRKVIGKGKGQPAASILVRQAVE